MKRQAIIKTEVNGMSSTLLPSTKGVISSLAIGNSRKDSWVKNKTNKHVITTWPGNYTLGLNETYGHTKTYMNRVHETFTCSYPQTRNNPNTLQPVRVGAAWTVGHPHHGWVDIRHWERIAGETQALWTKLVHRLRAGGVQSQHFVKGQLQESRTE